MIAIHWVVETQSLNLTFSLVSSATSNVWILDALNVSSCYLWWIIDLLDWISIISVREKNPIGNPTTVVSTPLGVEDLLHSWKY